MSVTEQQPVEEGHQRYASRKVLKLKKHEQAILPDEIANADDFSKVCRVCGHIVDQIKPIFGDTDEQHDLAELIRKYLFIKISENDQLPKGVCMMCSRNLVCWHKVARLARVTDFVLRRHLGARPAAPPEPKPSSSTDDIKEETKWMPHRISFECCPFTESDINIIKLTPIDAIDSSNCTMDVDMYINLDCEDHKAELDSEVFKPDLDNTSRLDDEDAPLSYIANSKSETYNKFYEALINFRNHYFNEHKSQQYRYPDFTESNSSDGDDDTQEAEKLEINSYDDLTLCNMRKDRMDEETRLELSEARTKVNGKLSFTCKICGKNLSSSHTYLFHKRIHTGERPCVCHICGKQFRAPSGLQRHLTETHERVRRYSCNICPKNFSNLQNLKQHFRIHTGERPFECSHCGKRFTQSSTLHVHLKTHSEEFPHQCTDCGAKFKLRPGLTRHRLKHTGERPHVCINCGKGFRQKHELNSHVLSHTDVKPHVCAACGAAFRQRKALRHHCKRAHDGNSTTEVSHHLPYDHVPPY